MRVLVVTSLYPNPLQPDRAPFNRQQIAALAAQHEVRVIAPIAWTSAWALQASGATNANIPPERVIVRDGVVVHHPPYVFAPKIFRSLHGHFFARSIRGTFHRLVAEFRPQVVLGCWAYPDAWAATRLAQECGLPVVMKVQGSDLLQVRPSSARAARVGEVLAQADAVMSIGRHIAEQAIALGAPQSKVHVVYNGIDTAIFSPGPKDEARRVLGIDASESLVTYVGNLAAVKGVDVLINSLASLRRAGKRVTAVIVGAGPMRGTLERLAASLGLEGSIRFVGSCPLERVALWHRATDLLVLPSRSEGVPNVLREAQACGTPFLASRVGGVSEIAPPSALFPPGDVEGLATRMRFALEHPTAPAIDETDRPQDAMTWAQSAREVARVLEIAIRSASKNSARAG